MTDKDAAVRNAFKRIEKARMKGGLVRGLENDIAAAFERRVKEGLYLFEAIEVAEKFISDLEKLNDQ